VPKCLGAELSRHFGTSAEVSGTGAEVSWYRSVLGPKCPVTKHPEALDLTLQLLRKKMHDIRFQNSDNSQRISMTVIIITVNALKARQQDYP